MKEKIKALIKYYIMGLIAGAVLCAVVFLLKCVEVY